MQDNIQLQPIQPEPNKLEDTFKKYFSAKISGIMKKILQDKRSQGFFLGNPPLGYFRINPSSKEIVPDPQQKTVVNDIFEKYATGNYTLSAIANELNEDDIKTKHNKIFTHNSIYGILKNKAYIGFISSPRKAYPDIRGKHQPIISEDLFFKVQKMLKKHKK